MQTLEKENVLEVIERVFTAFDTLANPPIHPEPTLAAERKEDMDTSSHTDISNLVVLKVTRGYRVEDLFQEQSYMVSKVNGDVFCSCQNGKDQEFPCCHKRAVWREWKHLKKLDADQYMKHQIQRGLQMYIQHLEQVVREMEATNQTGYRYEHYRGKLLGLKFAFDYISEA